jgi:hypothetical protein
MIVIVWALWLASAEAGSKDAIAGGGFATVIFNVADCRISPVRLGLRTKSSLTPNGSVGGTVASNSVSLMTRVAAGIPRMTTIEPGPNFAPPTRIV